MDLAIQATRYLIWLQTAVFTVLFGFGFLYNDEETMMSALGAAIGIFVLFLALTGLRSENRWVAIAFAIFCAFDFLRAMAGGLSLGNAINLVDAVLSFVVICGIVIWFRERSIASQDDQMT
ncbi:hypothetical protein HW561_17575 [Rhodobacteraceae bacterium B1Z28]|uniref:SPW repeat-containing protein n=1 Tax=Ruegeria haliotis TaxID=2747601 RepID=A0ABX2PTV8_9RHOB|nr:hypothetical protein [Ruegeria haliotis]NVO57609.1 hypothetical protein [Ruegeria haliotis]